MKIGTKSLLFGIHQVLWYPFVVYRAWKHLYGRPSWKEFVCIFIHDWGYWGTPNLDGVEGSCHPAIGAIIAERLFGKEYKDLCAGHSRTYVTLMQEHVPLYNLQISKLCWADKLSFCYEPKWFYIFRAKLSGEMKEVYEVSIKNGCVPEGCTETFWYDWMKMYVEKAVDEGVKSHLKLTL